MTLNWSNYNQWLEKDIDHFAIYLSDHPFSDVTGLTPFVIVRAESVMTTLTGLPTFRDHFIAIVAVDALGNFNPAVIYSAAYIVSPQAISREVSFFLGAEPNPPYRQVVSREMSMVVVTPEAPLQIPDFIVTPTSTGDSVTLNWASYNQWAEKDIARFDIYLLDSAFDNVTGLTPILSVPAEMFAATITGLPQWRDHYIAIVPVDGLGHFNPAVIYSGAYILSPQVVSREASLFIGAEPDPLYRQVITRESSFIRGDVAVPAPVTGLTSGFTAVTSPTVYRAIDLDWTSYNEWLQRDVVRYRIYVSTQYFENISGMVPFSFVADGTQRHALTGLFPSQIYYVAVVAEDVYGNFNPVVRAVSAQASNISAWRRTYFTMAELANPALEASLWGDYADPDFDGIANLLEYALGENLRAGSLLNNADSAWLLPVQTFTQIGNDYFYDLIFRRKTNASEVFVEHQPELSQDLATWFPANAPGQNWTQGAIVPAPPEAGMSGYESVALRLTTPFQQLPSRLFSRLRISLGESTATSYGTLIASANPQHHWRLDDFSTATTARDVAGGQSGTPNGGVTFAQVPHSRRGYAARFDGQAGTFIDIGSFHPGNNLSVEAWVRLDSDAPIGSRHTIVARWDGSYRLEIGADDRAILGVRNSTNTQGQAASAAPLTRGVWHHVVGIFNGGLPDTWELANGFDPLNSTDAAQDADGDGQTNLAEHRAGTDPRDPRSRFAITNLAAGSADISLTWSSVPGHRYHLQWSDDLADWMTVSEAGAPVIVDAAGSSTTFTLENMPAPERRFYRVEVLAP